LGVRLILPQRRHVVFVVTDQSDSTDTLCASEYCLMSHRTHLLDCILVVAKRRPYVDIEVSCVGEVLRCGV
jgi:hypothetical protein